MTEGFPIDPEVVARIRPMRVVDASRVAHLHHADMGHSLWARLGVPFLSALYAALIESRYFLGYVYVEEDRVEGFIAGTIHGPRLFKDVLRRRGLGLAWRAALGIARTPALLLPLLATPFYFGRSRAATQDGPADAEIAAESLFCSFVPHLRGRRISGHINKTLFETLARRGYTHVKVTTEADNAGATRQLTRWGFILTRHFHFYGKAMRVYVLDLQTSPRLSRGSQSGAPPR